MDFMSEIITRDSFHIENGSHNRDSILIVLEGRFSCMVEGSRFTAGKNDVCIFHREDLFQRKVLQKLKCVYLQFEHFPWPLPTGLLKTSDPVRTDNTIVHLAKAVQEEDRELTEHFLKDLLILHRLANSGAAMNDALVSRCISYLTQHYSERINLDALSQKYSISKQGLIRKFKKARSKTPMEYLTYIRISQSKLLLRDTALSVSEIADRCGFDNVYYFSNVFKRSTGLSPSGYRKLTTL